MSTLLLLLLLSAVTAGADGDSGNRVGSGSAKDDQEEKYWWWAKPQRGAKVLHIVGAGFDKAHMDGGPRVAMRRIRRAVLFVTKRVALCIIIMVVGGVVQVVVERASDDGNPSCGSLVSVTQHTNRQSR